jgi:3-hydroxyacyl-[acyl-carrier-protein] dehydratase
VSRPSPVTVPVTLIRADAGSAVGQVLLAVDDPAFAGHYPGFPVLPGVFGLEYVGQTLQAAVPDRPVVLREIVSAKFRRPIRPGDTLTVELTITAHSVAATGEESDLAVRARLSTEGGAAADLRLIYAPEES